MVYLGYFRGIYFPFWLTKAFSAIESFDWAKAVTQVLRFLEGGLVLIERGLIYVSKASPKSVCQLQGLVPCRRPDHLSGAEQRLICHFSWSAYLLRIVSFIFQVRTRISQVTAYLTVQNFHTRTPANSVPAAGTCSLIEAVATSAALSNAGIICMVL